jgi:hypothetical protein
VVKDAQEQSKVVYTILDGTKRKKIPDLEIRVCYSSSLSDEVGAFDPIRSDVNSLHEASPALGNLETEPSLVASNVKARNFMPTPLEVSI